MVNYISIREVSNISDVNEETKVKNLEKTAKTIELNTAKTLKAMAERRYAREKAAKNATPPKVKEAKPSINIAAVPFATAKTVNGETVVENKESVENHLSFDQAGSNFSPSSQIYDLVVII